MAGISILDIAPKPNSTKLINPKKHQGPKRRLPSKYEKSEQNGAIIDSKADESLDANEVPVVDKVVTTSKSESEETTRISDSDSRDPENGQGKHNKRKKRRRRKRKHRTENVLTQAEKN